MEQTRYFFVGVFFRCSEVQLITCDKALPLSLNGIYNCVSSVAGACRLLLPLFTMQNRGVNLIFVISLGEVGSQTFYTKHNL